MIIDHICVSTSAIMREWKNAYGWAPDSTANKLDNAMLEWIVELTECLRIWFDKGNFMTNGELILARANMGSLVECWLKFFYCVYYEDYCENPKYDKKGKIVEPNRMIFEALKQFSRGILWSTNDKWDNWVERIQKQRNAIHAFDFKEIGNNNDFLEDIDLYGEYINLIIKRLPESPACVRWDY